MSATELEPGPSGRTSRPGPSNEQNQVDAGGLGYREGGSLGASSSSESLTDGQHPSSSDGLLDRGVPDQPRHKRSAGGANTERGRSFTSAKKLRHRKIPEAGVNLRDIGGVAPTLVKQGMVFRSSELMSPEDMKKYGIKTILDLRRMDRPCREKETVCQKVSKGLMYLMKGPRMVVPEKAQLYATRGKPKPCQVCLVGLEERLGVVFDQVVHADLIPGMVGLRIFQAMPPKIKVKALAAALTGKGASSVMAPAVANPLYMGYKVLYRTMLEDAKRGVAKAIRVFVNADAFPVLLHCIHGKDRTGIIVMLLLMLCGVSPDLIMEDYIRSEAVLKESRLHERLDLDVHLTTDDVIAATRATMEETIQYITDEYGSVANYLKEAGLEEWELARVRVNLMAHPDMRDVLFRLGHRGSTLGMSTVGGGPFRRASTTLGSTGAPPGTRTSTPLAMQSSIPAPTTRRRNLFMRSIRSAPLDAGLGSASPPSPLRSVSGTGEGFMSGWAPQERETSLDGADQRP